MTQKAANTDNWIKKKGLYAMSWYRWNCPCCGPRCSEDRQLEHQSERAILKQDDFYIDEEEEVKDGYWSS